MHIYSLGILVLCCGCVYAVQRFILDCLLGPCYWMVEGAYGPQMAQHGNAPYNRSEI